MLFFYYSSFIALLFQVSLAQTITKRTEFSMPENSIPFTIDIPQSKIRDLQDRLLLTRLPNQLDGVDWEYGAELDYVSEVIQYWKNEFGLAEAGDDFKQA